MRVINADEYMERLRANIDTTADIVAKHIKKDEPIGTVKDGGQIGYLMALQWARNTLELDYYTIQAIPIPENATNGDMIMAMFPSWEIDMDDAEEEYPIVTCWIDRVKGIWTSFDLTWWDAPY